MKICYIANGESIHTKRWLEWFIKQGHNVYLITCSSSNIPGIKKEYIFPFKKKGGCIPRLSYIIKIRQIIKKIKPDIVHAHYVTTYGMYGALSNFHPFVVTGWGDDILTFSSRSRISKYFIKLALKKADFVTVFSKYLYENIEKQGMKPKNLEIVVPWKTEVYQKNYEKITQKLKEEMDIPSKSHVVVSPRNMEPIYRIENIINCIPHVIKKYPNTIFIILKGRSDDEYFRKVKTIIDNQSVMKNIRIISRWLSDEEMTALLRISNMMISIAKKDQFALTIREAMICGSVPVIGELEIYKNLFSDENVLFVSGDDSKEIADKIIYLIENPEKMKGMIEKNLDMVIKNESMEKKLDGMENIYFQLLDNNLSNKHDPRWMYLRFKND